ncbi:SKP1-like protein [Musa troglodytarum]|uniref:SKP1-like protein n=1 Tax=Musa troglodytarum TaxID=320322 RepID=A0A9E7EZQ0_9LILI|nr:SKP1-like protein [Musa troglodytarum]
MSEGTKEADGGEEKVVLKTHDGQEFTVDMATANQSGTVKNLLSEVGGSSDNPQVIPLPSSITSPVLGKVVEYCRRHAGCRGWGGVQALEQFDEELVELDRDMLLDVTYAAAFLDVPRLLDLTSQAVANAIKKMSVEEVRHYFGVVSDFTDAEEKVIRSESRALLARPTLIRPMTSPSFPMWDQVHALPQHKCKRGASITLSPTQSQCKRGAWYDSDKAPMTSPSLPMWDQVHPLPQHKCKRGSPITSASGVFI